MNILDKLVRIITIICIPLSLLLLCAYLFAQKANVEAAPASTFIVDTLIDENDGSCSDGDCSLRDAIALANDGNTIHFNLSGEILLSPVLGQLSIQHGITIDAKNRDITLNGDRRTRILNVFPNIKDVTLSNLKIINGSNYGKNDCDRNRWCGGGVYIQSGATVTITDAIINNNEAYSGGGIFIGEGASVVILKSWFSNNDSSVYAGAIYISNNSSVTINKSTISNNDSDSGAGIYMTGTDSFLYINNSTMSYNYAKSIRGGGLSTSFPTGGTIVINNSIFANNLADWESGGIHVGGNTTINNSTFSMNNAGFTGGAIVNSNNLTINNSTFDQNWTSDNGGAIFNYGHITITNSTFTDNNTRNYPGGAIYNMVDAVITVTNSTFSGNSTGWHGGAIANYGVLTLTNSTLSDNIASTERIYGAPQIKSAGIYNGPFLFGYADGEGELHLINTIIANSVDGPDCLNEATLLTNKNNLIETGNCAADVINNPQLAALGNYGGNTLTHALTANSPALHAADEASCPATDQRGMPRPMGSGCDIGAFESSDLTATLLPVIQLGERADLIVETLDVTGNDVIVTIKNIGGGLVTESFWVDVYINPDEAPTQVNQTWETQGGQGLVWGIEGVEILPNETVSLTLNSPFFFAGESNYSGSIAADSAVFAQVDSANINTTYGAVWEEHEVRNEAYNNITMIMVDTAVTPTSIDNKQDKFTNIILQRP